MKKLFLILLVAIAINATAQNALFIPDTLSDINFNLTMHQDSVQFFPGNISHTYAFNSNHYLGPTLFFNKGTTVNITVNNNINDTTTVHWHGLHVPSKWDGGPYSNIVPGDSWHPQFTIKNNAGTYWYHPHPDMKTAEQAIKGAAGLIIIRDSIESNLILPRKYGLDDFPIVVQCQQYDSMNQAMPRGMEDSTLLVNGTLNPYLDVPAQMVRLRLLNASGERVFNFGFTSNMSFNQIASDGGLLDVPYPTTRVRLAPGERAEVILNLSGMVGQTFYLMSYASELAIGIQGGPTMPMPPGSPLMDSPLNGIDYNILQLNVVAPTTGAVTTIPTTLTTNNPYAESSANRTRTIRFTADSAMVMDGPFYFNDSTFNMMRIDYRIPINSVEIWKLVNETMVAHPFHIHDEQFFILDRNGVPPNANELGLKDVVLVPPYDSVRFITKFTDFTDSTIPYMFHCHILMHEDDGMMGTFLVLDSTAFTGVKEIHSDNSFIVYPNPTCDKFQIQCSNFKDGELTIHNLLGETIYQSTITNSQSTVNISQFTKGIYFVRLKTNDKIYNQKLIKE
jgi:bilirubin oxidase